MKGTDYKTIGWFEALLCLIFPYTDIERDNEPGVTYLRRWFLYPRDKDFGKNKGKGRLYLHKFYRGDEDLHLHDHPWPFTSLILTRGYWEQTPYKEGDDWEIRTMDEDEMRKMLFYPRFS